MNCTRFLFVTIVVHRPTVLRAQCKSTIVSGKRKWCLRDSPGKTGITPDSKSRKANQPNDTKEADHEEDGEEEEDNSCGTFKEEAIAYIRKSKYETAFRKLIHHSERAMDAFLTVHTQLVKQEVCIIILI